MNSSKFFCIFIYSVALAVLPSRAHSFDLFVNGILAVKDTLNQQLFVTVLPVEDKEYDIQVKINWTDETPLTDVLWNDEMVALDFCEKLSDWHTENFLSLNFSEDCTEMWKVTFTPLPIVDLHLEHLENPTKDRPSEGWLRIVDAQKRTDKQCDFSTNLHAYYRGATARTFPKKSFTLCLDDEKGYEKDANILNIRSDNKWILDAMAVDLSRMRNRLCFDIWNEISGVQNAHMLRNGTQGHFVELVLNGVYHGLYCLSDKVNRKLLGVKKHKKDDPSTLYGRLYKCKYADTPTHLLRLPEKEYATDGIVWADWMLKYPNENVADDTFQPLIDLIHFTGGTDADTAYVARHLYDHFYKENVIDFSVFGFSVLLLDNFMHNSYLSFHNAEEDPRVWITPWDMDGSFGRNGVAHKCNWCAEPWMVLQKTQPFITFMGDSKSDYAQSVAQRWMDLRKRQLSEENVARHIDDYVHLFEWSGAWTRERERWNGIMANLEETPEPESDYMKQWYHRNYVYLDKYFDDIITGIEEIRLEDDGLNRQSSDVFTLDGRRVFMNGSNFAFMKGVYIVNGNKVVR